MLAFLGMPLETGAVATSKCLLALRVLENSSARLGLFCVDATNSTALVSPLEIISIFKGKTN